MPADGEVWHLVAPVSQSVGRETEADLRDLSDGLRVAFLSNHKPNADRLHRHIGAELMAGRGDQIEVDYYEKPNMARPAPTDIIKRIAQTANIVIVGSGD